jgi:hypothetical protein
MQENIQYVSSQEKFLRIARRKSRGHIVKVLHYCARCGGHVSRTITTYLRLYVETDTIEVSL